VLCTSGFWGACRPLKYQTLVRNLLVFGYEYHGDRWFSVNPILEEAEKLKQKSKSKAGRILNQLNPLS
jgi:hypothetical protein